jgi:hypothetical protein
MGSSDFLEAGFTGAEYGSAFRRVLPDIAIERDHRNAQDAGCAPPARKPAATIQTLGTWRQRVLIGDTACRPGNNFWPKLTPGRGCKAPTTILAAAAVAIFGICTNPGSSIANAAEIIFRLAEMPPPSRPPSRRGQVRFFRIIAQFPIQRANQIALLNFTAGCRHTRAPRALANGGVISTSHAG